MSLPAMAFPVHFTEVVFFLPGAFGWMYKCLIQIRLSDLTWDNAGSLGFMVSVSCYEISEWLLGVQNENRVRLWKCCLWNVHSSLSSSIKKLSGGSNSWSFQVSTGSHFVCFIKDCCEIFKLVLLQSEYIEERKHLHSDIVTVINQWS